MGKLIRLAVILAVMAVLVICVTPVVAAPADKDDFRVVPITGGPNNPTPKFDVPAKVNIPVDNPAIWNGVDDIPGDVFRDGGQPG